MRIEKLLLPREKYAESYKEYGPVPFTFEIETDKQVLYYFGANHSTDPENHQYPILKKYWKKFLTKTKNIERIVLVEGKLRELKKNEKTAIIAHSEGGFITFLAHLANVPIACPDLSEKEQIAQLSDFNKDDFLLRWFLAWVDNFKKRADPKPDFEQSLTNWCEEIKRSEIWKNIDVSPQRLKKLYKEVVGKDFNKDDDLNYLIDPNKTGTRINETSRAQSDLRDSKVVTEIEKYWKEGKSLFVIFGASHIVIQKPALEKLLI